MYSGRHIFSSSSVIHRRRDQTSRMYFFLQLIASYDVRYAIIKKNKKEKKRKEINM